MYACYCYRFVCPRVEAQPAGADGAAAAGAEAAGAEAEAEGPSLLSESCVQLSTPAMKACAGARRSGRGSRPGPRLRGMLQTSAQAEAFSSMVR